MKKISSKRAKACAIPAKVKRAVAERDSIDGHPCCIFCGSPDALPEAHFIPRSKGGLGIEQNIMTTCRKCHRMFDTGLRIDRECMKIVAREHFEKFYPDWNEEDLVYDSTKTTTD